MSVPNGMADQHTNWRTLMPREERVKICRHIMSKLGRYYNTVSEELLKQRTRSFEAKTFQSSNSREEYLSTIANCLTKVEEHVSQSKNPNQNPQQHAQPPIAPTNPSMQQGQPDVRVGSDAQARMQQQLQPHQNLLMQQQAQQQQQQQSQLQPQAHPSPQGSQSQQSQPPGPPIPSPDQSSASALRQSQSSMQMQQPIMQGKKPEGGRKHAVQNKRSGNVSDPKKKLQAVGKVSPGDMIGSSPGSRQKPNSTSSASVSDPDVYQRHMKQSPMGSSVPNNNGAANEYLQTHGGPVQSSPQAPGMGPSMNASLPNQHGSLMPPNLTQNGATLPQGMSTQPPHSNLQHGLRTSVGIPSSGPGMGLDNSQQSQQRQQPQRPATPSEKQNAIIAHVIAAGRALGRDLTSQDVRKMSQKEVVNIVQLAHSRFGRIGQPVGQVGRAPSNMPNANMNATNNQDVSSGSGNGNIMSSLFQLNNSRGQVHMGSMQNNGMNHHMALDNQRKMMEAHQQNPQDAAALAASQAKQNRQPQQQQTFNGQPGSNLMPGMSNPGAPGGVPLPAGMDAQKLNSGKAMMPGQMGAGQYRNMGMQTGPGGAGMEPNGGAPGGNNAMNNKTGRPEGTAPMSDDELWRKHDEIKSKYLLRLKRLLPIIHKINETRQVKNPEQFMKQLQDSHKILEMKRTHPTPPSLNMVLLNYAEKFVHKVLEVYSRYLQHTANHSEVGPEQKQLLKKQIETFQIPPPSGSGGPGVNPATDNQNESHQNPSDPSHMQQRPQANGPGGVPPLQPGMKSDPNGTAPDGSGMDMQDRHRYAYQQHARMQAGQDGQVAMNQAQRQDMSKRLLPNHQQHPGQGLPANIPGQATENGALGQKNATPNQRVPVGSQRGKQGSAPGQTFVQPGMDLGVAASPGRNSSFQGNGSQPSHLGSIDPKLSQPPPQSVAPNQSQNSDQPALDPNSSVAQSNLPGHRQSHMPLANMGRIPSQQHLHQQGRQSASSQQQAHQQGRHAKMPGAPTADGASGPGAGGGIPSKQAGRPTPGDEGPSPSRKKNMNIEQRLHALDSKVKDAIERVNQLEACVDNDTKRSKNERIHNTLAALRNNAGVLSAGSGGGVKRQASLADVDNFDPKVGSVKAKTVFECSHESGLRLAKRPKNEAADLKSLREAVEADCKAAKQRNPLLMIDIKEEFGQPVVTCLLKIPQIRLPKLVLRVQRGYPRKGGATYGFERPPMGWVGVLDEIRTRFKQALATAPAASVGVAAFLDAWAQEADAVINGSKLSDSR